LKSGVAYLRITVAIFGRRHLKAEYLRITITTGSPFERRVLVHAVAVEGPFENREFERCCWEPIQ